MTYPLFTIGLTTYALRELFVNSKRIKYKRANRYELRKHSPSKSQSDFEYYVDTADY